MLPTESPFQCYWWGIDLEDAGLGDARPDVGTYGQYEFDRLPPLPFEMQGDFAWLNDVSIHSQNIGDERFSENSESLDLLKAASARIGLRLPEAFTSFMQTSSLQQRIRSNTDSFLDLAPEPVRSPIGNGYLIRFLADSQGCLFWYLYVTPDGSDHAVVCSPGFYGTEEEEWQDEPPDPSEIVYCSDSFETFMCRYWIENEVWFAGYENTAMPEVGQRYISGYKDGQW